MTVIVKAKRIQIGLSRAQGLDGVYKKAYFGVRKMKLGKRA